MTLLSLSLFLSYSFFSSFSFPLPLFSHCSPLSSLFFSLLFPISITKEVVALYTSASHWKKIGYPVTMSYAINTSGSFIEPHKRDNNTPWDYLRLISCSVLSLFNLPLREQYNKQLTLLRFSHVINFSNLN